MGEKGIRIGSIILYPELDFYSRRRIGCRQFVWLIISARVHSQMLVAVHSCPVVIRRYRCKAQRHPPSCPINPSFLFSPARVSAFVSAIIAIQVNAAQHILTKTLLKEGFETKLIATEVSCSVRAVQIIHLKIDSSPKCRPPKNKPRRSSWLY
jgi:hypothetical protein